MTGRMHGLMTCCICTYEMRIKIIFSTERHAKEKIRLATGIISHAFASKDDLRARSSHILECPMCYHASDALKLPLELPVAGTKKVLSA